MTTRLRHVAIASADPDNSVGFFTDVLGWTLAGKIDSRNARGYYVTDGHINIALLCFKNRPAAGMEFPEGYTGLHHIGFQCDDIAAVVTLAVASPLFHWNADFDIKMAVRNLYLHEDDLGLSDCQRCWASTLQWAPRVDAVAEDAAQRPIGHASHQRQRLGEIAGVEERVPGDLPPW